MEDFDFGALNESKFEQTALDFAGRHAVGVFADMNPIDTSAESAIGLAQGYGWVSERCSIGHVISRAAQAALFDVRQVDNSVKVEAIRISAG
jgi:hypothetical protein